MLDAYHEVYRNNGLADGTTNLNETLVIHLQVREHLCKLMLDESLHIGAETPDKTQPIWKLRKYPNVTSLQDARNGEFCRDVPDGDESLIIMTGGAHVILRTPFEKFKEYIRAIASWNDPVHPGSDKVKFAWKTSAAILKRVSKIGLHPQASRICPD